MSVRGPTMLEELCKRIQHCCATLRRSRNKRNIGSCWLKTLTGFKLCATTSNNMKQGVQTDATCNIQQCWELLANNVASVSTGPKTEGSKEFNFWKDFYFALSENYLLQRHATHVCFHIIYQYRSSYIIKHWPAGNFMKNESVRAYCRSSPRESSIKRITRIVSQNLERAKQLTATTSTSKTAMSQTVVDNRMWYAI